MADTLTRLSGPTPLTTSSVTQFTASSISVIRNIHVCNETTNPESITLNIGTNAAGHRILKDFDVPGKGLFGYDTSIVLGAGETITALASAGAALTLTISGVTT